MYRYIRMVIFGIATCALMSAMGHLASAGTIIKLSLGGDSTADVEFSGGAGGILSTVDDGNAATTGDQNTAAEFLDFLEGVAPDIIASTASFTMDGLVADGTATVFGGAFVVQGFTGGTLDLYDAGNTLLLSGDLDTSALAGPLGPPATGGLFTTSFSTVTGGTLAPYIVADSLTLSMSLIDINGGAGLTVTPPPPVVPPILHSGGLNPFTADATLSIDGEVPEPAFLALVTMGSALVAAIVRRRRFRG
ncbi:MAG: hypothetical protein L0228_20470 [Planctomycetes bacterium]|nr:hypothetical protein [Planctomycetota bacterium]